WLSFYSLTFTSLCFVSSSRDGENDEENKPSTEFDFDSPFLFSDATLIVQGRSLHCHRAILSIYSPVFRAMFRNRCIENQKNEVVIPGDSYDDVKEILGHMYTPGGLEMTADSAQRLLPILHRYQIDSMVNMAERTLAFRLTDSTAPMCLKVADMYGLTRLRQAALESCARLDAERLNKVFQEVSLDTDLRNEILQYVFLCLAVQSTKYLLSIKKHMPKIFLPSLLQKQSIV
ncbi:hypothetical protein AHF37_09072, partial [Paragonimus kellicotti]